MLRVDTHALSNVVSHTAAHNRRLETEQLWKEKEREDGSAAAADTAASPTPPPQQPVDYTAERRRQEQLRRAFKSRADSHLQSAADRPGAA